MLVTRAKRIVQDALPGHVVDTLMQQSPERVLLEAADLAADLPAPSLLSAACDMLQGGHRHQQGQSSGDAALGREEQSPAPAHHLGDQATPRHAFTAFSTPGQGYQGDEEHVTDLAHQLSPSGDGQSNMVAPMLHRAASHLRFSQAAHISGPSRLEDPRTALLMSPPQSPTSSRALSFGYTAAEHARTEATAVLSTCQRAAPQTSSRALSFGYARMEAPAALSSCQRAAPQRCRSFRAPTQAPALVAAVEPRRCSLDQQLTAAALAAGAAGPASESGSIVLPLPRSSMTWQGPRARADNARVSCVEGTLAEQHPDACVLFAGKAVQSPFPPLCSCNCCLQTYLLCADAGQTVGHLVFCGDPS